MAGKSGTICQSRILVWHIYLYIYTFYTAIEITLLILIQTSDAFSA